MPSLPPQQSLDLAIHHHGAGRFAEAEAIYRHLLALDPNNAEALHLLGLIVHRTGSSEMAAELIRKAIAIRPANAYFHSNLGNVLQDRGAYEEAAIVYRRAIEIATELAQTDQHLGDALKTQGKIAEATAAYDRAQGLNLELAEAHNNLGNTLQKQGLLAEAIAAFHRAIALQPDYAIAYNNLGNALLARREIDAAIHAFQRALSLQPGFALAHNNLGNAFKELDRDQEAIAAYRQALALDPGNLLALSNLAVALHDRGELEEAIPLAQRVVDSPHCPASLHSHYLGMSHYLPPATLRRIAEVHSGYEFRHAGPLRAQAQAATHSRDPDRRLRLGFISPNFGGHPVGFFLVRLLENLDRRMFEVICYPDKRRADEMTSRLRACADEWHDIAGQADELLVTRLRHDRIDILFDLAGHTVGNRLLVFARKPAPIQITWLDYVGTTGLSAMDYILADPRQIPPEAEPFYREKVLRLPDDYICFDPPSDAPPVNAPPAMTNGYVTFASFNAVPKTTTQVVVVWSLILREIPRSRLVLKNRRFDDPAVIARYRNLFAGQSIDPDRVTFGGWSPRADLLAAYQRVDIALDPFPYNGGLTTCEALWMGVPVVTCPGETFASRHSLAHLTAAGFTETIARDLDDYVDIAVALAADLPRLGALRSSLRSRVAVSPLCDGRRFAGHFAELMREVWRRWCAGAP
jgi:predicted O-linked N-acetylglucosamine transferase (SPINDLY family)